MDEINLTGNALRKEKMKYHGKFGHTIGRILNIAFIRRIDIIYTAFRLGNQNVTPTPPGLQVLMSCIKYMDIHTL